ncbi:MAG TPA: HupE/UreJ family protein [Verrucomicrobiae bacterium]|nr:HupE/UreJ family protein [Verrucomicrobiae bacterium]
MSESLGLTSREMSVAILVLGGRVACRSQFLVRMVKSLRKLGFSLGLLCLTTGSVLAHTTPGSAVMLDFHRNGVLAELILPLEELQISFKQPLLADTNAILSKHQEALKDYLKSHINPETSDGRKWTVAVQQLETQLHTPPFDLIARVWMTPPAGESAREFVFNYSVINHEVMSHNALVYVRNDWDTAVFSGKPEPLGNIFFTITSLNVDRTHGGWWQGFRSVFSVGMHHIAEGTDHMLFLLVLLLPAPLLAAGKRWGDFGGLKRSLVQLLKIVTAFTVGHSFTLFIGAVGWLQLPSQPVEIVIAFSILVSALHAIRPWFAGREMYVAAGFGLIHGLAFAGSIAEYGFSPWYLAATILGFNLGIELMQLIVVAVTVPWLILLARTPFYSLFRNGGAIFAALASLGWIAERGLAIPNPFEPAVNVLAHHPLALVSALAVAALSATALREFKKWSSAASSPAQNPS